MVKEKCNKTHIDPQGFILGACAYMMWGVLPVYWKQLAQVPAMEILAHRIAWSFVFVFVLLLITGKLKSFKILLADRNKYLYLLGSSAMITVNWGLYIWAVNSGYLVEASMGYYINPLLSVLLGIIVMKETASRLQYLAFAMAGIGVIYATFSLGHIPWVALSLAVSFAIYGLLKKKTQAGSIEGLAIETAMIAPFFALYLIYLQIHGTAALLHVPVFVNILLILSGVVTAIPLLSFAGAANRIGLSTLGFLQYISPSLTLLLGVLLYKETFTHTHLISFIFIWSGLVVYTYSLLHSRLFSDEYCNSCP